MIVPVKLTIEDLGSIHYGEFKYVRGEPVSVKGENRKHPSLKTNGVGKSLLKDAVVIVLADMIIRDDVGILDLISDGATEMVISHEFHDTHRAMHVHITRHYFTSKHKAQVVEIMEIDNVSGEANPVVLGSVVEYNKWIFEWLGISKEELFNFYIISKKFKPFHSMGDEDKKEEIMKISRSSSVNFAISNIEDEIATMEKSCTDLSDHMESVQETVNSLTEQIELADPKKQKEAILLRYNTIIAESEEAVASIMIDIEKAIPLIELEEKAVEETKKAYDEAVEKRGVYVAESPVKRKELEDELSEIDSQILETDTLSDELELEVTELDKVKADCNKSLRALNTDLANIKATIDGAINCPKCEHKFSIETELTIEELEASHALKTTEVKALAEDITATDLAIKEVGDNIAELVELKRSLKKMAGETKIKIDDHVACGNALLRTVNDAKVEKNSAEIRLTALSSSIARYDSDITSCEAAIEKAKADILDLDKSDDLNLSVKSLKKSKETMEKDLDKTDVKLSKLMAEKVKLGEWKDLFGDFKIHITNTTIVAIQDLVNQKLIALDNPYRIAIKGFTVTKAGDVRGKISTDVILNGNPCKYGRFSEGERARIDICTILVFQEYINKSCKSGGLDLLIIDEKMDSISSKSIGGVIEVIKRNKHTSMIITQLEDNFEGGNELTVIKMAEGGAVIETNY